MSVYTSVIIVAAGSSSRMGYDKLFEKIGGKTVIEYTLEAFEKSATTNEIVIVSNQAEKMRELVRLRGFTKIAHVCSGGATRAESVIRGLEYISRKCEFISIHDGARPLILPSEIDAVHGKAYETGAALCGYYSADTVKIVDTDSLVTSSPDRRTVFCAATPQAFRLTDYRRALAGLPRDSSLVTDDATLLANIGVMISAVTCSRENFKLTTPDDFVRMRAVLEQRQKV